MLLEDVCDILSPPGLSHLNQDHNRLHYHYPLILIAITIGRKGVQYSLVCFYLCIITFVFVLMMNLVSTESARNIQTKHELHIV